MKSVGAPSTSGVPVVTGRVNSPTRPMSWYSGSHDTSTSSSGSSDVAWAMASRLAPTVRCGSITPFGSDVDPLVNCRIARRSGSSAGRSHASAPARPGPGCTASQPSIGGSPGSGSMNGASSGSTSTSDTSALVIRTRVCCDELLDRRQPHREREHHDRGAGSARWPGWRWRAAARSGRGGRRGRREPRRAPGGWRRRPRASSWSWRYGTATWSPPTTKVRSWPRSAPASIRWVRVSTSLRPPM